jgi:hypothetical protein
MRVQTGDGVTVGPQDRLAGDVTLLGSAMKSRVFQSETNSIRMKYVDCSRCCPDLINEGVMYIPCPHKPHDDDEGNRLTETV